MFNLKRNLYWLRDIVVSNPILFQIFWKLKFWKQKELFFSKSTEIVIEGFPRSANTFAVVAFEQMQNEAVNIAHHLHAPAQLILASKNKVPAILLIREPKDALISLMIMRLNSSNLSPLNFINSYINFYSVLIPYLDDFVITDFKEIISDLSGVIIRVNKKFEKNFQTKILSDSQVFTEISKISKRYELDELKASSPSLKKNEEKEKWKNKIEESFVLKSKIKEAQLLYKKVMNSNNGQ